MNYKAYIGYVDATSSIEEESISLSLNYLPEEPNSGNLIIYWPTRSPLMDLRFQITIANRTHHFIVESDIVRLLTRGEEIIYEHSLTLIERVFLLSKISCSALSFLKRTVTLYDALKRVNQFSGNFLRRNPQFSLKELSAHDSATQSILKSVLPKQALSSATLLDQLSSLANPAGLAVKVEDQVIMFEKIETKSVTVLQNSICETSYSQSFSERADRKVIEVSAGIDLNLFSTNTAGLDVFASPRSDDVTLADDNLTIGTPFPAWKFEKVHIYAPRDNSFTYYNSIDHFKVGEVVMPAPWAHFAALDVSSFFVTAQAYSTLAYADKQKFYYYNLHKQSQPLTAFKQDNPFFARNKLASTTELAAQRDYLEPLRSATGAVPAAPYDAVRFDISTGKNTLYRIIYTPEIKGRFVTGLGELETLEIAESLADLPTLGARKTLEVKQLSKDILEIDREYGPGDDIATLGALVDENYALIRQQLSVRVDGSVLAVEEYRQNLNEAFKYTAVKDYFNGVGKPDTEVERCLNYSLYQPWSYDEVTEILNRQEGVGCFYATVTDIDTQKSVRLPTAICRFGQSYAFTFQMETTASWGDKVVKDGSLDVKEPVTFGESFKAIKVVLGYKDPSELVMADWDTEDAVVFQEKEDVTRQFRGINYFLPKGYYYTGSHVTASDDKPAPLFQYIGPSIWNIAPDQIDQSFMREVAVSLPETPTRSLLTDRALVEFTGIVDKETAERLIITIQIFKEKNS